MTRTMKLSTTTRIRENSSHLESRELVKSDNSHSVRGVIIHDLKRGDGTQGPGGEQGPGGDSGDFYDADYEVVDDDEDQGE